MSTAPVNFSAIFREETALRNMLAQTPAASQALLAHSGAAAADLDASSVGLIKAQLDAGQVARRAEIPESEATSVLAALPTSGHPTAAHVTAALMAARNAMATAAAAAVSSSSASGSTGGSTTTQVSSTGTLSQPQTLPSTSATNSQRPLTSLLAPVIAQFSQEQDRAQRILFQQQQEQQRQSMKQQLDFFQSMRQQQQALQRQRETQIATSAVIQRLLEENNNLIRAFYEQVRVPPSADLRNSSWGAILDQIGQNLKTLSQLMSASAEKNSESSSSSSIPRAALPSTASATAPLPTAASLPSTVSIRKEEATFPRTSGERLLGHSNFEIESQMQNLGAAKANPHSTAAVLAAAAALAFSRYGSATSQTNSLGSHHSISSSSSSTHQTPATSPSWKLFSSGSGEISPPYIPKPKPIAKAKRRNQTGSQPSQNGLISSTPSKSSFSIYQGSSISEQGVTSPGSAHSSADDQVSVDDEEEDSRRDPDFTKKRSRSLTGGASAQQSKDSPTLSKVEAKRPRTSYLSPEESVPAQEVLATIEGLPKEFVESTKVFSKSEARHWVSIKSQVARAGKRADALEEPDKWRAWVEITSDLPLNNGGPIRRVLEVATFCAERSCRDPKIIRNLRIALGPSVYKANAAGGCRRMALDMLNMFPIPEGAIKSKTLEASSSPASSNATSEGPTKDVSAETNAVL